MKKWLGGVISAQAQLYMFQARSFQDGSQQRLGQGNLQIPAAMVSVSDSLWETTSFNLRT